MRVKDVTTHYTVMCTTVARKVIILISTFVLLDRRVYKSSPDLSIRQVC
jgi:hypothetical protein